jgi:hypothetical protein
MSLNEFLSFLSALGLGGLVGICVKYYFDRKTNKNSALFIERLKTYSTLNTRLLNYFSESDIRNLPTLLDKQNKIQQIIAEALLISGEKLGDLLISLRHEVVSLYRELDAKNIRQDRVNKIGKKIDKMTPEIFGQMREDLL